MPLFLINPTVLQESPPEIWQPPVARAYLDSPVRVTRTPEGIEPTEFVNLFQSLLKVKLAASIFRYCTKVTYRFVHFTKVFFYSFK